MPITELIPSIIYGAVLLFILGALAALWNRMGSILRDIGRLDAEVAGNRTSLNEKTEALQTSINEKTEALQTSINEKTEALQTSINEKTEALQTSINEVRTTVTEMQLQMQRNHYQLMMAILSHSHRPDGRPTFDLPPDFEPPAANEPR